MYNFYLQLVEQDESLMIDHELTENVLASIISHATLTQLEAFLARGVVFNPENVAIQEAFIERAASADLAFIKIFIDQKINLNVHKDEWTALHAAVEAENIPVIDFLLKQGVRMDIEHLFHGTQYDFALSLEHNGEKGALIAQLFKDELIRRDHLVQTKSLLMSKKSQHNGFQQHKKFQ
jgi:ankyrin repeat protein